MRWTLLAALFAACCATNCLAETPDVAGSRPQAMQLFQGRLFSGQGWWNRYGEPVNATALAAQPAEKLAPVGPMPAYGDGYVFGPGSCDCPPPCISHLWNGYYQNPKRCHPHVHRHCGCANGSIVGDECAPCRGMLARVFGNG